MGTKRELSSIAPSRPHTRSGIGAAGTAAGAFAMPFTAGELIAGKYKIIDLIGTGGVGFVVSARHVRLDELVAIKFLRPDFASHPEAVRRFTIEARANFKIKSEHVARVIDVGTLESGTPYMVMEYLEGSDLGRRARDARRAARVRRRSSTCCRRARRIAEAHARGIVHRDLKPANLFLAAAARARAIVKVLDFGISKLARLRSRSKPRCTATPDRARLAALHVARADALGATTSTRAPTSGRSGVLYELLTGVAPFERASVPEICTAVVQDMRRRRARCAEHRARARGRGAALPGEGSGAALQDIAELAAALVPFAPPHAAKFAERCKQLLDPNAAPPARPSTPPALEPSIVTEISALRRASRRGTTRFVAGGAALIAVSYVIARVLGATPAPVSPASHVAPAPVVQTAASTPEAPSVAPVAEPAAAEATVNAPAEPQLATRRGRSRKPLRSRAH